MTGDQAQVTYDVKYLLDRIDQKLDGAISSLDKKADMAEFDSLDERLDVLERWRWKITGMATLAVLLGGAALEIAASHHW